MSLVLCFILIIVNGIHYSGEIKFIRTIEAIGIPYYKVAMTLGSCQENTIFSETKAWPTVRMNRVMDIYYKGEYKISSVVIKLIINNTDCLGFSDNGIGSLEFSATLFFADNMGPIFYSLAMYTCDRHFNVDPKNEDSLLFYTKKRKFYLNN